MIDNDTAYDNTFPVADESDPKVEQGYRQWYTSPLLDNMAPSQYNHTITVTHTHGVAVDFAVINITDPDAPNNVNLNDDSDSDPNSKGGRTRQVLVDDQNPEIHYEGDWTSTTASKYWRYTDLPGGTPIGNSTHQSRKTGDCLEFRFFGTSIGVVAIWFPPPTTSSSSPLSSFSESVISDSLYIFLDGKPQPISSPFSQPKPFSHRSQNLLVFSQALPAANHTLTVTYKHPSPDNDIAPMQYLLLDYITYTPSFSTLRDKPDLSAGYKGCTGLKIDDGEVQIGMIVGVVLGLFVLALATIGFVLWWNKKKKRRRRNANGNGNGNVSRETASGGWVSISIARRSKAI
ncbi:hypothetical protein EST38_g8782 [Candolleomyces aberdarensis]|uniref:Uncharacterized protein n=1 Tax=Candolleomyces aberdarensis TaxID=2316362 RepID=A0A4Q2DDF3_9AGAR|nr:hypothetical protein EST38_g8782 [Candolleomyces aberdarensis]